MRLQKSCDSGKSEYPPCPDTDSSLRLGLYRVASSPFFSWLIITLIFVNTISLTCVHYDMDTTLADSLEMVNWICGIIFVLEVGIKMIGWGPVNYLSDGWCRFDLFVAVMAVLGFALTSSPVAQSFRAMRLFRVVKLVKV